MSKRPRRSTGLEARINAAQTPIYVLDRRRKITIFNSGLQNLTGHSADQIVGKRCDYASPVGEDRLSALLGSLSPPQSVFDGEAVAVPSYLTHADGHTEARVLHHFPLTNRDGTIDRVLTIALPIQSAPVAPAPSPARKLHAELASLRSELRARYGFSSVVAAAPAMHRVLRQVVLAGQSTVNVHFVGEDGTGREHLARVTHNKHDLGSQSFVPLDCRRLSSIELTRTLRRLFDKEPGSTPRPAHLRAGTLFLRDVDRMPRDVQALLAESWSADDADFPDRLITSSRSPLTDLVRDEHMVAELGTLCGTLEIALPPLRARLEDLPTIAQLFLEQCNIEREDQMEGFASEVMEEFLRYGWPGNLAELHSVVTAGAKNSDEPLMRIEDLPLHFHTGLDARRTPPEREMQHTRLEPLLAEVEREHIQTVLAACNNNRAEAARKLGLTRPRLYRRMNQLGITVTPE